MSDTPNSKVKGISFNLDNGIEKFMYDHSCRMKQRKESFSQLMKHLYIGYLINIGESPPGIASNSNPVTPPNPKEERKPKKQSQISKKMPFQMGRD